MACYKYCPCRCSLAMAKGIIIFPLFFSLQLAFSDPIDSSCAAGQARLTADGECYKLNTRGPCGLHMTFIAGGDYGGVCDCEDGRNPEFCSSRPYLKPAGETNQCFAAYQKGPCPSGQWLVPDTDGVHGICKNSSCIGSPAAHLSGPGFVFPYKGICHKTGTRAFCNAGKVALFQEGTRIAQCYDAEKGACGTNNGPLLATKTLLVNPKSLDLPCPPGFTASVDGQCVSIADFQ